MGNANRTTRQVEKITYVNEDVVTVEMTVATAAVVHALIGPVTSTILGSNLSELYSSIQGVLEDGEIVTLKWGSEVRQALEAMTYSDFR